MTALSSLPSDMSSTIVAAASSVVLASNVARSMQDKRTKKNGFSEDEREIMEQMREYMDSREEVEEEEYQR